MVYVLSDVICGTVAIGNDWSAGRNLKGNSPGMWFFVDFGSK